VSVLDFLSPGSAADADGFHPIARSSMERRFQEAGASFEERDGWLVPVSVPGEAEHLAAVGVADLSHLTKLEVRPAPPSAGAGIVTYEISPRRGLLLFSAGLATVVNEHVAGAPFVLDVTAQLGILAIVGPEAHTVIRRLTHLHQFPSSGAVAHITAHLLELALGGTGGYWIVFGQEYGHYLYEVAVDRAAALGGGPVGVDALGEAG
jgi:glycine cleavage system aminomethyltransferase T